jgi:hypothetical protein
MRGVESPRREGRREERGKREIDRQYKYYIP